MEAALPAWAPGGGSAAPPAAAGCLPPGPWDPPAMEIKSEAGSRWPREGFCFKMSDASGCGSVIVEGWPGLEMAQEMEASNGILRD